MKGRRERELEEDIRRLSLDSAKPYSVTRENDIDRNMNLVVHDCTAIWTYTCMHGYGPCMDRCVHLCMSALDIVVVIVLDCQSRGPGFKFPPCAEILFQFYAPLALPIVNSITMSRPTLTVYTVGLKMGQPGRGLVIWCTGIY